MSIRALVCLQMHMQEPEEGIGSLRARETGVCRNAQFFHMGPGIQARLLMIA